MMEVERQLALLEPIMKSAIEPVLGAFNAAAMQAKSAHSGGSRTLLVQQAIATEYSARVLSSVRDALEPTLNRAHLEWNDTTAANLKQMVRLLADSTTNVLCVHVRQKQTAYPEPAAAAVEQIEKAVALHLSAVEAHLELYVADRRRSEVLSILSELEQRLVAVGGDQGTLALIRGAKREAESPAPDSNKLKNCLEVISTSVQGLSAAIDLGPKLLALIQAFSS